MVGFFKVDFWKKMLKCSTTGVGLGRGHSPLPSNYIKRSRTQPINESLRML